VGDEGLGCSGDWVLGCMRTLPHGRDAGSHASLPSAVAAVAPPPPACTLPNEVAHVPEPLLALPDSDVAEGKRDNDFGVLKVSGRLAPEVIQTVVRQSYAGSASATSWGWAGLRSRRGE
jgi:hypothetical protein